MDGIHIVEGHNDPYILTPTRLLEWGGSWVETHGNQGRFVKRKALYRAFRRAGNKKTFRIKVKVHYDGYGLRHVFVYNNHGMYPIVTIGCKRFYEDSAFAIRIWALAYRPWWKRLILKFRKAHS